ncbi:RluA family pseudouridine synthase [Lacticaseibacillus brantae]|uniref:Pseudouridine synthase n=1 Tax=Lacticaseibacillus brantae DSM 23927 TaxID=1423727 RepID=A0A0R2B9I3_9LACO|nr:RluA family pseudouridine synthase [Lacticaseibacillus brantae]KRM72316.1 pseudouridylate synthase, 23S RNA-specific [Lacticaseibacillus brantae DSM 23927]
MRFEWTYLDATPLKLQNFLRQQGFSRAQLTKLKFHGGSVFVNSRQRNTAFVLHKNDRILLELAPEVPADAVVPFDAPIEIAFEDEHYLIVNKPAGVASIPDAAKGDDTMANRVKAYLIQTKAESTAIHVVTRLDRDTSGLMMFAKHGYAHSLVDRQLHSTRFIKRYLALIPLARPIPPHGWLMLPIGPSRDFYMKRAVNLAGKASVTEYQLERQTDDFGLVRVTLHTGRTHQIRVHFAAIGHPLIGDDLYGGELLLNRQALHCAELAFYHPFRHETIALTAPLPPDMRALAQQLYL